LPSTIKEATPKTGISKPNWGPPNCFTFLRLLLASLVIVAHAAELRDGNPSHEIFHLLGSKMTAGDFAVEAFFVVSGYLILQSWSAQPQFTAYLIKRVLRIVPAFLAAYLISAFLVGWLGGGATYFSELLQPSGIRELVLRLVLLTYPATPGVFLGSPAPMVNGALWTISYEFRCYLLIPVLAALGFYSRTLLLAIAWLAVALGVGLSCVAHLRHPLEVGLLRFVPFFLAGNCAYLYRDRIRWNRALAVVCILACVLSMGSLVATRFVLPIAGSYAILWVALSEVSPLRYFSPASDFSYGVYLYGWPTQKLLLWYFPWLTLGTQMLLGLGISMVLGWLSWNLIEKRCLAWKTAFGKMISPHVRIGADASHRR
jgi:peptidoglycan/LPS O-acetylase OafA/YrhL